jgi:ethanolamine utilization protein EutN
MILARVEGTIVATKKHDKMNGSKLLFVRPLLVDPANPGSFRQGNNTIVATDELGCGEGEVVLIAQGSSARLGARDRESPIDAVVVGIVDTLEVNRKAVYRSNQP